MPAVDNVFFASERTYLFIDGPNNHAAARALGIDIDYKKLLTELRARTRLVRVYYYTPVIENDEYSTIRPLLDWLDYNGYQIVTKPIKEQTLEDNRRARPSMDVELTIDALRHALQGDMDHMVLFSGSGDLRSLVTAAKQAGVRVSVVSALKAQQALFVADELRRAADQFIELTNLNIGRQR